MKKVEDETEDLNRSKESITDVIDSDVNIKEGTETFNANEFSSTEKDTKKGKKTTEETDGFDVSTIDGEDLIDIIDIAAQVAMPLASASMGGKMVSKDFALKPKPRKILIKRADKALESYGEIEMKPIPALLLTLVGIYGAMLAPDFINFVIKKMQGIATKKAAQPKKGRPQTNRQKYEARKMEQMTPEEIVNYTETIDNENEKANV